MRGKTIGGLAVACIVWMGCADDITLSPVGALDAATSHASGSRLRAAVVDAGTAKIFVGWIDTKLGIRCRFQLAEDGVRRCLPDPVAPLLQDGPLFYVVSKYRDFCGNAPLVAYRTHGPAKTATTCEERYGLPPPDVEDGDVHLWATDFVKAEVTFEPRGPRLAAEVLVAEDGAREVEAIADTKLGKECAAFGFFSGTPARSAWPCAPVEHATMWGEGLAYFAGSNCPSGDALAYFDCGVPQVVVDYGRCGDIALYAVGPTEMGPVVQASGASCGPASSGAPHRSFVHVGARLAGSFEAMSAVAMGEGRIRSRVWVTASGAPLRAIGELVDASSGTACSPTRVGGELRCVPSDLPRVAEQYADAACTTRLVVGSGSADCGAAPDVPELALLAQGNCDAELHAVAEPYAGPVFAHDRAGGCVQQVPSDGMLFFRLGPAVDASRFAPVTERVE